MIQDQHSAKPVSRQRKYQYRHKEKGLCMYCAEPAVMGDYCLDHAIRFRERTRKRKGCRKRLNSLSYRMQAASKKAKQLALEIYHGQHQPS